MCRGAGQGGAERKAARAASAGRVAARVVKTGRRRRRWRWCTFETRREATRAEQVARIGGIVRYSRIIPALGVSLSRVARIFRTTPHLKRPPTPSCPDFPDNYSYQPSHPGNCPFFPDNSCPARLLNRNNSISSSFSQQHAISTHATRFYRVSRQPHATST